jgi:arylsulfatase A-like enzyme
MTMDFLPTFAKLAGANLPDGHQLDGVDVMPYLKDETKVAERILHWLHDESWAVRKGPWKLIGKAGKPQSLVNLEKDVSEQSNLIKLQPALAEELMKSHRQWMESIGSE